MLALLVLGASPAFAQKKTPAKAPAQKAATTGVPAAVLLKGKSVYTQSCLSCHQADGAGVDGLNPPLGKTDYVLGDKTRLINVLLNGLQGQDINGEPYHNVMPSQDYLTDQQMADVLTYVRNSFGNKASVVTVAEVKAVRGAKK
ncbi:cytochrome c [Siccationidurans soli]|uniref:Cytochrome c n=2 Tax=Hymenobacter negativus TaxID=2795026 RepID=A0ABS3Q935_9BACT|nr:cytochrome c [Hymenobacter negativus]MBO2007766.1 cytochrome c [Hymenobacter negativus]